MIKILNVFHAPIAKYGPFLKIINILPEGKFEGGDIFLLVKMYSMGIIYGINMEGLRYIMVEI
jgi:hypothetical protein